jgi:hypothetical protein
MNPPHESASDGELLDGLSWMGVAVEGCRLAAVPYGDGSAMVVRVKSMRILWCVCAWRKADVPKTKKSQDPLKTITK